MKETSGAKLLKGAALLAAAAILSKLLGTLQKIPLQNLGGDGVFGIYNTVYPFYTLLVTLATAGFSASVSKFVAEREAAGDLKGGKEVLRISALMMMILGLLGGLVLFFGAHQLSRWIGSPHIVPALKAAAPALLFVPASAALKGYFQGRQNMLPTAVSQVTEQAIRVAVMIVLLLELTSQQAAESTISAGAMLGSSAGAAAGLLIMLLFWQQQGRLAKRATPKLAAGNAAGTSGETSGTELASTRLQRRKLLKELLLFSLPICLAALAVPLISLVDTFTLPRLLTGLYSDSTGIMAQIGVYNRGIPLVQLVTMMASSLSVLFIPSMAELKFKGRMKEAAGQAGTALRWFWLIGCAAAVGLGCLASPINIMLYKNATGSDTLLWLALSAAPATLATVSAALLQGLGSVRAPAWAMVCAATLKILLNLLLVPELGINGAALAGFFAYGLAAAVNLLLLARTLSLTVSLRSTLLRPAVCLGVMAAAVLLLRLGFAAAGGPSRRLGFAAESLIGVLLGAAVFAAAALRLSLIKRAELLALPRFGPRLVAKLDKLGLMPRRL